jgi:hypothetical protein
MNKIVGIMGWIVAAITTIGFVGYVRHADNLSDEVELVRTQNEAVELQLSAVRQQLERDGATDPSIPTADLISALESANAEIASLRATYTVAPHASSEAIEKDNTERSSTPANVFAEWTKKMSGSEEMMATQAKMTVSMMYGSLMQELNLPVEVRSRMEEILINATKKDLKVAIAAMSNEEQSSGRELYDLKASATDQLHQELSEILTADEMLVWEDFEANMAMHLMEKQYQTQLDMFATALTAENRTMVRDVLVDEYMNMQEAFQSSDSVLDTQAMMAAQVSIFDKVSERLSPILDSEQYAVVETFLEHQATMLRMGQEMMGGVPQPDQDEDKADSQSN